MIASSRQGLWLLSTTVWLSVVGLFSTLASAWVLTHEVGGQALTWITLLSVTGAFVALPTSIVIVRRLGERGLRVV